jgi:PKD repeat protein
VYTRPGTYTATVTARDSSGNIDTASTTVIISSLPVTLTAAPATTGPGSPVTYTVGGVTGAQVDHYEWTYDDGTTKTTTSPQDTHAWSSRGTHTARVVVIAVGGGTLGTAEAVVNITGA